MIQHNIFKITYTQKQSIGKWYAEDDYQHERYSEPVTYYKYYVTTGKEIALAHFDYWKPFCGTKDNPVIFVSIEDLGKTTLLLEIH